MGHVESRLRSLLEQHKRLDNKIKSLEKDHVDDMIIKKAKIDKLQIKQEIENIKANDKITDRV